MPKTKIQEARERQGLTVSAVLQKAGLSRASYYRYEQGQRNPDAPTAVCIAKALKTTVEALWGAKEGTA